MSYAFGDVILVPFPFTDQTTTKRRPAVFISNQNYASERPDLILLAITSQVRGVLGFGEALVTDWQEAGLIKPSVFKPLLTTIEQSLVIRRLGKLSAADAAALRNVILQIIG
jgi:mRNA interferase MazF